MGRIRSKWASFDTIWGILAGIAALLIILIVTGLSACTSDTRRISNGATRVGVLADDTKEELQLARDTGAVGEEAMPHIDNADAKQDEIKEVASEVHSAVAGVTDKEWAGWAVLKLWGIVAVIVVFVAGAIYFGFGGIIRRLFNWIGWFIPERATTAAVMDREVFKAFDDEPGESRPRRKLEAAIAAKRGKDKEYDAAWVKMKKGERKITATALSLGLEPKPRKVH